MATGSSSSTASTVRDGNDLDDDCFDEENPGTICDDVVSEGSITYTAQLTGAFVFGPRCYRGRLSELEG